MNSVTGQSAFFRFERQGGVVIRVVMPKSTKERLADTCFRGVDVAKSGNLSLWPSFDAMMEDKLVIATMLQELDGIFASDEFDGEWAFSFVHPDQFVGWSSTILNPIIHASEIEYRKSKTGKWGAMFFKDPNQPAPLTHTVTFICTLFRDADNVGTATIRSIYPGPHVGQLKGNMTAKTKGMVWFEWENPGGNDEVQD